MAKGSPAFHEIDMNTSGLDFKAVITRSDREVAGKDAGFDL